MNSIKANLSESARVIFLDNLRYLFVIFVAIGHSGNAYSSLTKWWPVSENSSAVVDYINLFFDAFTMPLLFFIAGYFTLPSIGKGTANFLKGKLKRLGVPWVLCILTICPVLPLIFHFTRNGMKLPASYADIWLSVMNSFIRFDVGIINTLDELMRNNGFYQRYMWFVSLLLLFFFVFSIVYKLKSSWFIKRDSFKGEKSPVSRTLKIIFIVGGLSFVFSTIFIALMFIFGDTSNPTAWFTLGNVIQFRPLRIAPFIIFFIMGIIAYKNSWVQRNVFPGHFKTWAASFAVFLAAYMYDMNLFMSASSSGQKTLYGAVSVPIYSFLTISILGVFTSIALRYWNRPTAVNRSFAANSYNIYLSHYIFVQAFQLMLLPFAGIPVLVKFIIVSALSIGCAYTVSRFLIKPYPKLTAALLFFMLITMFAVIKP